jgi:hypothetical protein
MLKSFSHKVFGSRGLLKLKAVYTEDEYDRRQFDGIILKREDTLLKLDRQELQELRHLIHRIEVMEKI